ncbi:hypothetical protein GEMRC1_012481 [Eukaryota sp. GEM-RC1]
MDKLLDDQFLNRFKLAQSQGLPSEYRGFLPPSYMVYTVFEEGRRTAPTTSQETFSINHSMGSAIRHRVIPPIHSLRHISLSSVVKRVNHIHSGRVLFGRIIADPWRVTGTQILIEDLNNDIIQLSSYNLVPNDQSPSNYFPKGSYIAVIEPYMKNVMDSRENIVLLRCDHPEGIVVFHTEEEWLLFQNIDCDLARDPHRLKDLGTKAFVSGQYSRAIDLYKRALDLDPPSSLKVILFPIVLLVISSWSSGIWLTMLLPMLSSLTLPMRRPPLEKQRRP